jgi:hypothetical protein
MISDVNGFVSAFNNSGGFSCFDNGKLVTIASDNFCNQKKVA